MESELNELSLALAKKVLNPEERPQIGYYGDSEDLLSESSCYEAEKDTTLSPRHDPPNKKPPAWRNQFMSEQPIGK